mmetsp:Transcript_1812/g.2783  ORF Transcript_1812/g.2783 Transcript_1812/m.2783 type:complete len:190 (-) Transcript_1812:505-1074(-)
MLADAMQKRKVSPDAADSALKEITDRCYFDVTIDGEYSGRIIISLYGNAAPLAAKNFKLLCTGSKGYGYRGNSIYRIISGLSIQGGDWEHDDGTGGYSALDDLKFFQDESFAIKHDHIGIVSSASRGSNKNGSRFFITLDNAPWADDKYVAFGLVTEGLNLLERIGSMPTRTPSNRPVAKIVISAAGVL